jgi:hypothetical protein
MTLLIESYFAEFGEMTRKGNLLPRGEDGHIIDENAWAMLNHERHKKQESICAKMSREELAFIADNYRGSGRGEHAFRQKWLQDGNE